MERKSVLQEHAFGCGIACIAFLSQHTYQEITRLIDPTFSKARNRGFTCKELVSILYALGYSFIYKYVKKHIRDKIYVDDTIVFIKRSPRYPAGHYLIRHHGKWIDPWINFVQEKDIQNARSGFRKRLPGKPIYALLKKDVS